MRPDDNSAPALNSASANEGSQYRLTYVLPLRRWELQPLQELAAYLVWLSADPRIEVLVVDGSPDEVFEAHQAAFAEAATHMRVERRTRGGYDKVHGVLTGVRAARSEKVIIADDDVRYDHRGINKVSDLLETAHLVRPQNYFDPAPWHARWDTARSLINRSVGYDYPGTLGLRRSALVVTGGYDADVLFENLELIRTIDAVGGNICNRRGLYVRRLPPTAAHFHSQRVRQAYDSFSQPVRLAIELSLLPSVAWLAATRRTGALALATCGTMALAELGRRRSGGRAVFPVSCTFLAPAWTAERAVCAWLAVWMRLRRGGVSYAGGTLARAANSPRVLRRRLQPLRF